MPIRATTSYKTMMVKIYININQGTNTRRNEKMLSEIRDAFLHYLDEKIR